MQTFYEMEQAARTYGPDQYARQQKRSKDMQVRIKAQVQELEEIRRSFAKNAVRYSPGVFKVHGVFVFDL